MIMRKIFFALFFLLLGVSVSAQQKFSDLPQAKSTDDVEFLVGLNNKSYRLKKDSLSAVADEKFYPTVVTNVLPINNAAELRGYYVKGTQDSLYKITSKGVAFFIGFNGRQTKTAISYAALSTSAAIGESLVLPTGEMITKVAAKKWNANKVFGSGTPSLTYLVNGDTISNTKAVWENPLSVIAGETTKFIYVDQVWTPAAGKLYVNDFGAKFNRDNADAFTKNLQYLQANSGAKKVITFKSGRYAMSSAPLSSGSGRDSIFLQGDGLVEIVDTGTYTFAMFFGGGGYSYYEFDNITFHSKTNTVPNFIYVAGTAGVTDSLWQVKINKCNFIADKIQGNSIYINDVGRVDITNCKFISAKWDTLIGANGFTQSNSVHILRSQNITYKNNQSYKGSGLYMIDNSNVVLDGNTWRSIRCSYPLQMDNAGLRKNGVNHGRNFKIINNSIISDSMTHAALGQGSSDHFSIYNTHDVIFANNISTGSGDLGFSINGCDKVLVQGNTTSRNNTSGIYVGGCKDVLITGNICTANGVDPTPHFAKYGWRSGISTFESISTVIKNNWIEQDTVGFTNIGDIYNIGPNSDPAFTESEVCISDNYCKFGSQTGVLNYYIDPQNQNVTLHYKDLCDVTEGKIFKNDPISLRVKGNAVKKNPNGSIVPFSVGEIFGTASDTSSYMYTHEIKIRDTTAYLIWERAQFWTSRKTVANYFPFIRVNIADYQTTIPNVTSGFYGSFMFAENTIFDNAQWGIYGGSSGTDIVYKAAVHRYRNSSNGDYATITPTVQSFTNVVVSGTVLFPRLTTAQRDAISSPPDGLQIYNTTTNKMQCRAAGAWVDLH